MCGDHRASNHTSVIIQNQNIFFKYISYKSPKGKCFSERRAAIGSVSGTNPILSLNCSYRAVSPARTVPSAADPSVAISWPCDTGPLKGSEVLVPMPLPASQAGHSSDWASSKVAETVTGRIAVSRETKGECPCTETSLVLEACFSRLVPLESKSLGAAGEGQGACQKGRLLATALNLRKP